MPIVRQLNEEYKTFLNEIDTNDPKTLVGQVERIIKKDISDEEKRTDIEALGPIRKVLDINLTALADFDKNIERIKETIAITDGLSKAAQNALNGKLTAFIGTIDIRLPAEGATQEQVADHYQQIKRNIQVISEAAALLPGGLSEAAQDALNDKFKDLVSATPFVTKSGSSKLGFGSKTYEGEESFQQYKTSIQELSKFVNLTDKAIQVIFKQRSQQVDDGIRISNTKFTRPFQDLLEQAQANSKTYQYGIGAAQQQKDREEVKRKQEQEAKAAEERKKQEDREWKNNQKLKSEEAEERNQAIEELILAEAAEFGSDEVRKYLETISYADTFSKKQDVLGLQNQLSDAKDQQETTDLTTQIGVLNKEIKALEDAVKTKLTKEQKAGLHAKITQHLSSDALEADDIDLRSIEFSMKLGVEITEEEQQNISTALTKYLTRCKRYVDMSEVLQDLGAAPDITVEPFDFSLYNIDGAKTYLKDLETAQLEIVTEKLREYVKSAEDKHYTVLIDEIARALRFSAKGEKSAGDLFLERHEKSKGSFKNELAYIHKPETKNSYIQDPKLRNIITTALGEKAAAADIEKAVSRYNNPQLGSSEYFGSIIGTLNLTAGLGIQISKEQQELLRDICFDYIIRNKLTIVEEFFLDSFERTKYLMGETEFTEEQKAAITDKLDKFLAVDPGKLKDSPVYLDIIDRNLTMLGFEVTENQKAKIETVTRAKEEKKTRGRPETTFDESNIKSAIRQDLKDYVEKLKSEGRNFPQFSNQDYDKFIQTALEFYKDNKARSEGQWQEFKGVSELKGFFQGTVAVSAFQRSHKKYTELKTRESLEDFLVANLRDKLPNAEIELEDVRAKLIGDTVLGPQDRENFKEIFTAEYIGKALAIAGDNPDLKYFQARVCLIAGDAKAFGLLGKLNEKRPNNPKILTDLGQCHEHGIGVEKNEGKAFGYYQQAAEQTHAPALFALGHCYEDGIGVEKDEGEAFQNYQQAATQNFALAQHELGRCNQYGIGVEKNERTAFEYYQKAAKQNFAEAQYELGVCYEEGIGTVANSELAFECYKAAAEQGHIEAQYNLGRCYEKGIGVEKDDGKAFESYKAAAKQGLKEAQYKCGQILEKEAEHWKEISLGSTLTYDQEAFKYYQLAADQDHKGAQFALGRCYEEGIGCRKNPAEAFKYYQLAADQDHKGAQYNLGRCYAKGRGCSRNPKEALKIYAKLYQDIKGKEGLNTLEAVTKKQIKSVFAILREDKNLLNSLEFETLEILRDVIHSRSASYFSALWTTDAQIVADLIRQKSVNTTTDKTKDAITKPEASTSELPSSPRPQYQPTGYREELKGQDKGLQLYKINTQDEKSAIRIDGNKWGIAVADEKIVTNIIQNIGKAKDAITEAKSPQQLNDFAMAVIQFAQANDGVGNAGQDKWQSFCAEQNLTDPLYSFDNAAKFSKAYQDAAKGSSMFTGREENLRTDKNKSDLGARLKRIPESFNDEIKAKLNSQSRSV